MYMRIDEKKRVKMRLLESHYSEAPADSGEITEKLQPGEKTKTAEHRQDIEEDDFLANSCPYDGSTEPCESCD